MFKEMKINYLRPATSCVHYLVPELFVKELRMEDNTVRYYFVQITVHDVGSSLSSAT